MISVQVRCLLVVTFAAFIAFVITSQWRVSENFENGANDTDPDDIDGSGELLQRTYMSIYGIQPPKRVTDLYTPMIRDMGLDEPSLKNLLESDLEAAPQGADIPDDLPTVYVTEEEDDENEKSESESASENDVDDEEQEQDSASEDE